MPEKGVDGKFVKGDGVKVDGDSLTQQPRRGRAPRRASCKKMARQRFTEQMPTIIEKLTDKAKDGSVRHLKALLELAELDKPKSPAAKRRGKSLEAILREQWKKDDEEEAAREAATQAKRTAEDEVAGIESIDPPNPQNPAAA